MNTDPGFFHFSTNEDPDRRGLLELQWFQGLDKVMTSFHERHPDVWVEWCASGGRMISLAACRYSHSHWITDYVGPDPDIAGAIRAGANSILPAVCNHQSIYLDEAVKRGQAPLSDEAVLSHFAGHLGLSQGLMHAPEPVLSKLEEMGRLWKSIRPLLSGDFYLLTGQAQSREDWEIWQMHRADLGQGVVCIHRLSQSRQTRRQFALRGVGSSKLAVETLAGEGRLEAAGANWTVDFEQGRILLVGYRVS
jgi:alpha-galactosidase